MKVIIICKEPFPYGMAGTSRIQCYAKAWIKGGVDCQVVVFSRHEKGRKRNNSRVSGVFEGIPFRYSGPSTRKPGIKIFRILSEKLDFFLLKRYLCKSLKAGDVVFGYFISTPEQTAEIIDLIHRKGAKFIKELCEIPYFGSESPEAKRGYHEMTTRVFPKFDGVIAISDKLVELAQRYVSKNAAIIKIPIMVEFDKYDIPDQSEKVSEPYIFHSGTLYDRKDGILGVLDAFAIARTRVKRPLKYYFSGDLSTSPDRDAILDRISAHGLQNDVVFTGYLEKEKCRQYLSGAALVIINKYVNAQNEYAFSTKLGEYLAAGKSLLTTDFGEAMNWLVDGESARIVPVNDVQALADGIVELMDDRQLARRLGQNGKALCQKNFDWCCVSDKLCKFVESV